MSFIKDLIHRTTESLERGDYATVLENLKPWGKEAPLQLWGLLELLASNQEKECPECGTVAVLSWGGWCHDCDNQHETASNE